MKPACVFYPLRGYEVTLLASALKKVYTSLYCMVVGSFMANVSCRLKDQIYPLMMW